VVSTMSLFKFGFASTKRKKRQSSTEADNEIEQSQSHSDVSKKAHVEAAPAEQHTATPTEDDHVEENSAVADGECIILFHVLSHSSTLLVCWGSMTDTPRIVEKLFSWFFSISCDF